MATARTGVAFWLAADRFDRRVCLGIALAPWFEFCYWVAGERAGKARGGEGKCAGFPLADAEEECSIRCARWRVFSRTPIGWNRIGVLLSLAIIGVAVVVLFHMLREIKVR